MLWGVEGTEGFANLYGMWLTCLPSRIKDFKEFKQPERLTAKSELWGLYEFLVKDTEDGGGERLDNFALSPLEKKME